MRSAGKPDAPVIEKLGMTLVRVLADNAPPDDPNKAAFPAYRHAVRQSRLRADGGHVEPRRRPALLHQGWRRWKIIGFFGGAGPIAGIVERELAIEATGFPDKNNAMTGSRGGPWVSIVPVGGACGADWRA